MVKSQKIAAQRGAIANLKAEAKEKISQAKAIVEAMSEYQYYEFLAIDRPLTEDEIDDLRDLSTRAHITPVSFTNEYNWGDFKGSPNALMQRYFDAHVYVANWMTAIFMVRLPLEALEEKTAKAMSVPYMLDFKATRTHWIITWSLEESEDYDRFGLEDGRGWMARLAPVRDELLLGDLRSLYIGWLAAVNDREMDDDQKEPLPVSGMGQLTSAQLALAEFLEVDPDLVAGAGTGSPAIENDDISREDTDAWIRDLPRDEVTAILRQLLEGSGRAAERTLKDRFAAWRRARRRDGTDAPRRTVGELRANAERARQNRMAGEKLKRKRLQDKRRKEREAFLKNLSLDFPKAWNSVRKALEKKSGAAYDKACRAIVDLRDAYALCASQALFQEELRAFMVDYRRRKALIQRLVKVGIWKEG